MLLFIEITLKKDSQYESLDVLSIVFKDIGMSIIHDMDGLYGCDNMQILQVRDVDKWGDIIKKNIDKLVQSIITMCSDSLIDFCIIFE